MEVFNTSLVREKIVFTDQGDGGSAALPPVTIRSNRIFLKLGTPQKSEKVVIRAQNMHSTLLLTAKVLFSYYRNGLILDRAAPFDWDNQWDAALSAYEKEFNQNAWAAVYINGKSVFKTQTSPFVDVIEKCALLTIDNYDATMEVTENALKQIGRAMTINHSSNVASVMNDTGDALRCGIIHRADGKDTTFSFVATGGEQYNRIVQCVTTAAAYLEGFNLQFNIRSLKEKIRNNKKVAADENQMRAAIDRLGVLKKVVSTFEGIYNAQYRPERPKVFSGVK